MTTLNRRSFTALSALAALSLTACSNTNSANTIKIGTTEAGANYWQPFRDAATKAGYKLEVVNFSDYSQVNPALTQKQIDINLFQHLAYLANYNVGNNTNIAPLGSTYIVPLSLYSKKYKSVAEIPSDAEISIPNDPTNQARALLVLQSAGILTLKNGGSITSTPADIETKKVDRISPIDASQTAGFLDSVGAAVVNNGFAADANLDLSWAIHKDDPNSDAAKPYINVLAVRDEDKTNEKLLKVLEWYHQPEVIKAVIESSKNTAVEVKKSREELATELTALQDQVKASK